MTQRVSLIKLQNANLLVTHLNSIVIYDKRRP